MQITINKGDEVVINGKKGTVIVSDTLDWQPAVKVVKAEKPVEVEKPKKVEAPKEAKKVETPKTKAKPKK